MPSKITHAGVIPLIGGMSMGASQAFGGPPMFFASYPAFTKNERHAVEHYRGVPHYNLDVPYWRDLLIKGADPDATRPQVVTAVCPCAGLSITSSRSNNHGAESTHNVWMYKTAEFVLGHIKPKVMFGENAPGLFQAKGAPVARRLYEIGKENGYSFSMVYTDTTLHGVPQKRPRTFYFFWAAPKAPKFKPIKRADVNIADYMRQVKYPADGAIDRIEFCRYPLKEDVFYQFAVERWGDAWRAECDGRTIIDQLKRDDEIDKLFAWVEAHAKDHPQYDEIMRHKDLVKSGRGVWDASPKVVSKYAPAVMFKNFERIVHPYEDRFLNVRELMSLMGFPVDFRLHLAEDKAQETALSEAIHHLSQNVPVATARDMGMYVRDVLERKIPLSDTDFYLFDNVKQMRLLRADAARIDPEDDDD